MNIRTPRYYLDREDFTPRERSVFDMAVLAAKNHHGALGFPQVKVWNTLAGPAPSPESAGALGFCAIPRDMLSGDPLSAVKFAVQLTARVRPADQAPTIYTVLPAFDNRERPLERLLARLNLHA